jgi:tetratricopeptide (TPR) repeat protein
MKLIVKSLLFAGLLFFGLNVSAQSVSDAGNLYNQANQQFKNKAYGQAVKLYEKALQTCKDVGPDAFSLQSQVSTQLAKTQIYYGVALAKEKKFDEGISQLMNSVKLATSAGDAKTASMAKHYASLVYFFKGNSLFVQKDYTGAYAQYQEALKLDPNNLVVYVNMSKTALEQKDFAKMDATIAKMKPLINNDVKGPQYYGQVRQMAFAAYLNAGAMALQKEKYTDALSDFDKANGFYSGSATLYYYVALANVKLKRWDAAISNGQKALGMERNSKSDIYFTLGQAYEGKGLKDSACKEYKNVKTGPNVAAAKYQIKTVLKCK